MALPTELVEAILDTFNLESGLGKRDLRACSLVCKDWGALSQTRLFRTITLSKPSQFPRLLNVLSQSTNHPHISSAIRRIEVDVLIQVFNWCNDPAVTDLVTQILLLPTAPQSVVLRGPRSKQRVHWATLPGPLQDAVMRLIYLPSVEELEIDGWVFNMPIQDLFCDFLSSPHLRRVYLKHAFSEAYSTEQTLEEQPMAEPLSLNLDVLHLHVDDYLDVNPKVASDFAQILQLNASTKLDLRVWLNTAFWAFGNCGDFLTRDVASAVQKLELIMGFRNNYIFGLSDHVNLSALKIDGSNSPAAIHFVKSTLTTLPPGHRLRRITLKLCFYTLPKKQWAEFMSFLAETLAPAPSDASLYPDLALTSALAIQAPTAIHFDMTMSQGIEDDLALSILRDAGLEVSVDINDGRTGGNKQAFPFYLYSRF